MPPKGIIRLDSLLKFTARQTGVVFSFDAKKLKGSLHLNIPSTTVTLAQLLDEIKRQAKMELIVIENYIVLNESKPVSPQREASSALPVKPTPSTSLNPPNKSKSAKSINQTTILKKKSITEIQGDSLDDVPSNNGIIEKKVIDNPPASPLSADSVLLRNDRDTLHAQQQQIKRDAVIVVPDTTFKNIPDIAPTVLPSTDTTGVRKKNKASDPAFFLQAGITMDESLYAGSSIHFGVPLLFGTISFNTNFTVSQFRYGIGSSVRINNQTKLILLLNMGVLKRGFNFIRTDSVTQIDSATLVTNTSAGSISIRSRVMRIGLLAEFRVSERLRLQVGPLFNFVKTNYQVDGSPSGLGSIETDANKKYYTIKPLYTFKDTYSPTSSTNIQTWMGLQLNIFYKIF